jgi:hypothetical protein
MASAVFVREASFRPNCSVADGGERAFDDVGRSQVLPVLGREVVEGEQRIAILDQALDRLFVLDAPGLDERVEGSKRISSWSRLQISCSARLAFGCWLFAAC